MTTKMKKKHDKYWGIMKNINMMIFIAVVLDRRYKFWFVGWSFGKLYDKVDVGYLSGRVNDTLNRMFNNYFFLGNGQSESATQTPYEVENTEAASENLFALQFEKDMSMVDTINKDEMDICLIEALHKKPPNFDILNLER